MAFEQKDGQFAAFPKTSKAGNDYFNGTLKLNGKDYSVTLFEKVAKTGNKYISGIVEEKEVKVVDNDIPF